MMSRLDKVKMVKKIIKKTGYFDQLNRNYSASNIYFTSFRNNILGQSLQEKLTLIVNAEERKYSTMN